MLPRWRADATVYTHREESPGGVKLVHHAIALGDGALTSPPRIFESATWPEATKEYRKKLSDRLQLVAPAVPEDSGDALLQIHSIAAAVGRKLIPDDMARWLWRVHDAVRSLGNDSPVLLLQCTEPSIPWELLWLRDPDEARPGQFLAEAFALSHWITSHEFPSDLPLHNIGLVVPKNAPEIFGVEERSSLLALANTDRRVTMVPARIGAIVKDMLRARFDGWHLIGHGRVDAIDPEASEYFLERGGSLTPSLLEGLVKSLEPARPLVFANFCDSGRREQGLTGPGGLAETFLKLGCGAYLGTLWPIDARAAAAFAPIFYREFISGSPLAEAVRRSRITLRDMRPGDPAWLTYTLFGPPLALCGPASRPRFRPVFSRPSEHGRPRNLAPAPHRQPTLPAYAWQPGCSAPSVLLRPEYGVVPCHGRQQELDELTRWLCGDTGLSVRFLLGAPGVGKTRLGLELCGRMRAAGWTAGFLDPPPGAPPSRVVDLLKRRPGDLLLVLDDPGTRMSFLRLLTGSPELWADRRLRILALGEAGSWSDGDRLLGDVDRSVLTLASLASTEDLRENSFLIAGSAFAERLGRRPPTELPVDSRVSSSTSTLVLHMHAWSVTLSPPATPEKDPLRALVNREKHFWQEMGYRRRLPNAVTRAIEPAMVAISALGGALNAGQAREVFSQVEGLAGQPPAVFARLGSALHDAYCGRRWIDPLLGPLLAAFEPRSHAD